MASNSSINRGGSGRRMMLCRACCQKEGVTASTGCRSDTYTHMAVAQEIPSSCNHPARQWAVVREPVQMAQAPASHHICVCAPSR